MKEWYFAWKCQKKTSKKEGVAKIVARFAYHFFLNPPISKTWIHPCTSSNSIKPPAKKRARSLLGLMFLSVWLV